MLHFTLHDEAATQALGSALARSLSPGLTIYLIGELGAGKTTLTRALLYAAGHTGRVKSPTYTLVEPYTILLGDGAQRLLHFDLYRMQDAEEFLDAGFREEFDGKTICIVEWPQKAAIFATG
jgi:tRNA threonylcarbamoyladenosine biosynthesis protein TsaE